VTIFVDTSALYSLLDGDDINHRRAEEWFTGPGQDPRELLVTHSYVVVESEALVRGRLGRAASRIFLDAFVPALSVLYVDEHLHRAATIAYLASTTKPSLVDRLSFQMMKDRGISQAFAFDRDFPTNGFQTVP
jgi:predicted nucleic acid-binding protein